jgi:hypothetical protein
MQDLEKAIRERAYHLWNESGRQEGNAEAHWLTAQRETLASSFGALKNGSAEQRTPKSSKRAQLQKRARAA